MDDVSQFDRADHGLLPVAVEQWGCLVFVNLDAGPAPLAEQLGDLPQRLAGYRLDEWRGRPQQGATRSRPTTSSSPRTSWSTTTCPGCTRGWSRCRRSKAHHRWQGAGMYTGMCTSPIAANTDEGGWKGLPPISGLCESDATSARFVVAVPQRRAQRAAQPRVRHARAPADPAGRTLETTYLLAHPESSRGRTRTRRSTAWRPSGTRSTARTSRSSSASSRVSGSLAYPGGRMCYRFEEPLHRFQNMVVDRMVGIRRDPARGRRVRERHVRRAERRGLTPLFRSSR